MTLRAVLALTLLVVPVAARAQPKGAATGDELSLQKDLDALFVKGGLTADEAAVRAVKTSPAVRARIAQLDAAIAQMRTAELARVPIVAGTARYTRLSPLDSLSFGPTFSLEFPVNNYTAEATLQVPLSDYLVRFPKLVEAARLGTESARVSKRSSEVDAASAVRVAYYEWVRARLQTLIATRQLAQVRATLVQVRALADAQRVSRADLLRVESQEADVEQVADVAQLTSDLREEQLRILIGAGNEPLVIGEDIREDMTAPPPGELDAMVSNATKLRLDFQALDLGIRAKEEQRGSERAGLYPSLSAFATADYARPNQRVFPQVDEFRFTWQAGVQLTWTLNEALITNAQDKRYLAEVRELRANRETLERGTRIEVLAAQQGLATAQRSLVTTTKGLTAAVEAYRVRQALLQAQRATAVELVDAETELTRARVAALNARINLRIAKVVLLHATGADTK